MNDPTANPQTAKPRAPRSTPAANLLFDAAYSAVIGGGILALFFFVVDLLAGEPLYTPSLIGAALFEGADPGAAQAVRLDMVAYLTIVHLAAFGAFGFLIAWLRQRTSLLTGVTLVSVGMIFVLLTGGAFAAGALFAPGLAPVLGVPKVLLANFLAAIGLAFFLSWSHEGRAG